MDRPFCQRLLQFIPEKHAKNTFFRAFCIFARSRCKTHPGQPPLRMKEGTESSISVQKNRKSNHGVGQETSPKYPRCTLVALLQSSLYFSSCQKSTQLTGSLHKLCNDVAFSNSSLHSLSVFSRQYFSDRGDAVHLAGRARHWSNWLLVA